MYVAVFVKAFFGLVVDVNAFEPKLQIYLPKLQLLLIYLTNYGIFHSEVCVINSVDLEIGGKAPGTIRKKQLLELLTSNAKDV